MSFDYSTLFHHLGSLIARINSYNTLAATTLASDLATLLTAFGTTWLPEEGIASTYQGLQDSVTGWRQTVAGFADSRLVDPATVLVPLGLDPSSGLDQVLPQLLRQMRADSQTVKACTSTWTQPSAIAGNQGNGAAFVSGTLDGYNSPVLGAQPSVYYSGVQTQFTVPSETHYLEVTADSMIDGLPVGSEVWSWTGGAAYGDLDYHSEGSGEGPSVQTANGQGILTNGDFEVWASGVPTGWTLLSGSIAQSAAAWTGASALEVLGAATLAQPIASGLLQSKRLYFVSVALKGSGLPGSAQVNVFFQSASAGGSYGGVALTGSAISSSYQVLGGWLLTPAPLPSDWQIVIEVQGGGTGQVWVDSLAFAPAVYHGGVALGIAAGSAPWQRGDRLSFTTTNDAAGLFQTFFRRHWLTQLPAVASGVSQGTFLTLPMLLMATSTTETILDSWVA